jgi:hypothetical protein
MANMYINAMSALWNSVGTFYSAIKMNVTNSGSAANSRLIDLQVGSVDKFYATKDGHVYAAGNISAAGNLTLGGAMLPSVADTTALGSLANPWSDLFLGGGGTVNWANSDVLISHATDVITVSGGDLRIDVAGTNTASAVTVGGTQNLTNKTLTGALMNGTVGATTPSTGAFTTVSASGLISANGGVNGAHNGTVGATTPATGAFTTLTTSGNVTVTGTITASGGVTGGVTGAFNGTIGATTPNTGAFTTATATSFTSTQNFLSATSTLMLAPTGSGSISLRPSGAGSATGQWSLASSGAMAGVSMSLSGTIQGIAGTLGVTGGLSATGTISATGGFSGALTGEVGLVTPAAGQFTSIIAVDGVFPEDENSTIGAPGDGWGNIYIAGDGALNFQSYDKYQITYVDVGEMVVNKLHFSGAIEVYGSVIGLGSGEFTGSLSCNGITNGSSLVTGVATWGTYVAGGASVQNGCQINASEYRTSRTGTASTNRLIFYNASASAVGTISTSGTATAYNVSSDERLKENFRSFESGAFIDAINTYQFEWKEDGKTAYGVRAQECYEVFPDAITVGSPGELEDGDEDWMPWSADYSKFVPLLLAEVKALRARVAALEGSR